MKKKTKSVWIINQYITTPRINGDGHRHYYLAKELVRKGLKVTLFCCSYAHVPNKKVKFKGNFHLYDEEGFKVCLIKTPHYQGARSIGRIWSMLVFFAKLFFIPKKKLCRPKYIIVSSLPIFPIINGVFLRRKYKGSKLIFEIRDIYPLTLTQIGGFSKWHPIVKVLSWIEKFGYKNADIITSTLPHLDNHIKKVINIPFLFTWTPNGVYLPEKSRIEYPDKNVNDLIPNDKFVIGYAGTIGMANALEYLIDAARRLKDDSRICFCILGEGPLKNDLQNRAKGLDNVIFLGKVSKSQAQNILQKFDILYLGWRKSSLYNYGISANKLYDYMYSGKPILMSGNVKSDPITQSNCGMVVPSENTEAIKESILTLIKLSTQDLNLMGKRGKEAVIRFYSFEKISEVYLEVFNFLKDNSRYDVPKNPIISTIDCDSKLAPK